MEAAEVIARLRENIAHYSPGLQRAAKYIIDHPAAFALDPIRETARAAGVSTYSLVRLAETLGFESFDALREPFRDTIRAIADSAEGVWGGEGMSRPMALPASDHARLSEAVAVTRDNLEKSLAQLRPERLHAAVAYMRGARRVYVMGYRAAMSAAYYFHYIGRMALPEVVLAPRQANTAVDELMEIGARDVLFAITFNPYSKETIEACRFAQERGARMILLTDSPVVTPDLVPDIIFTARVKGAHPLASFTAALGVMDLILAELIHEEGEAARTRIAAYEALRDRFSAYWRRQG